MKRVILVIDDNSDDGTEEYIKSLKDSRIRYIKNSINLGPAGARNEGARLASADIIAFQDSDDEWLPDKLQKQMEIMSHDTAVKLVHCSGALYNDGKFADIWPLPDVPTEFKQGNLFHFLCLNSLIITPTILVWKKEFLEIDGFNERLKSLEDYEFTIRFSLRYEIGFVDDVLVNIYDSSESVNKRYKDKIYTQMYIVEEMLDELKNANILWKKLELIKDEAESYDCLEVFDEELGRISSFLPTVTDSRGERENQLKVNFYYDLVYMKDSIYKLYLSFGQNERVWNEEFEKTLNNISNTLKDFADIFQLEVGRLLDGLGPICERKKKEERLSLLKELLDILLSVENIVSRQLFWCSVCKNHVFFKPISSYLQKMRMLFSFPYWDAQFQLESRENYECPVCHATDRDRLIIAFLDELQSENGEKLKMLQIAPSKTIEEYVLDRSDILYESTDLIMADVTFRSDIQSMDMAADNTYDIIVCSHVLENIENDRKAMDELYRIMKEEGVLIVLVSLIEGKETTEEEWGLSVAENWKRFGQGDHSRFYGRKDFIQRLEQTGFIVNELGMEYFGEEFYRRHGFDEYSILYIATKADVL